MKKQRVTCAVTLMILSFPCVRAAHTTKSKTAEEGTAEVGVPVLWRSPTNISSRDLFYGPGGKEHQPGGTFTFLGEDLSGTQTKIVVRDDAGVKWTVKLGLEARPEIAASRLVWAVGYSANEDYFLPRLTVRNMPPRLSRGQKLVAPDGSLHDARLKRHLEGEKKIGAWSWRRNPFSGTRELNGLRVMMALIDNWDLTEQNNAIYTQEEGRKTQTAERIYMVKDLGSSFGSARLTWPLWKAIGNVREYAQAKFPGKVTANYLDFGTPGLDFLFLLPTPSNYFMRTRLRWIGRHIPRDDAMWIGQVLAQLSSAQIRDAFRAADYSLEEVDGFATALQNRIATLAAL